MEVKELTTIEEKRAFLRDLSQQATEIKENLLHACENDTQIQAVNDLTLNKIIIDNFYKSDKDQEFNTFKGWIKEGFQVKKGEKAFLIWGRPKDVQDQEKGKEQTTEEEDKRFFPVSFIFSNAQVRALNND